MKARSGSACCPKLGSRSDQFQEMARRTDRSGIRCPPQKPLQQPVVANFSILGGFSTPWGCRLAIGHRPEFSSRSTSRGPAAADKTLVSPVESKAGKPWKSCSQHEGIVPSSTFVTRGSYIRLTDWGFSENQAESNEKLDRSLSVCVQAGGLLGLKYEKALV